METTGIIVTAKVVRGVADIVIDTLEDLGRRKRKRKRLRYPLSKDMSEQDLLMYIGKGIVKISITGGLIDNIWPE